MEHTVSHTETSYYSNDNLSVSSGGSKSATKKEKRVFDEDVYNTVMVSDAARTSSYMEEVIGADDLKELCRKNVPFWEDLKNDEIELKLITISLTNKVYMVRLVTPESGSRRLNKVLLRKISQEKSVLYDIDHQNVVCTLLGDYGFCPKLTCSFEGGRIEEWIDGFVLHSNSLFNLSVLTSVATLLAKFHKTITAVAPKNWDRAPSLLNKMEEWLPQCREINKELGLKLDMDQLDSYFNDYKEYLNEYLNGIEMPKYEDFPQPKKKTDGSNSDRESERNQLSDEELYTLGTNYGNRVLFCHNDLHLKNLIATYDGLTLIDFEYSSFNYVGADIGYFFVESNFDYDCTEYPFFKLDRSLELSYELKVMFASVYLSESLGSNVLPTRRDIIDPFLRSVELYSLGTLLFWAYWGIIMKSLNEVNDKFNYIEYTKKKVELFKEKFDEFRNKK